MLLEGLELLNGAEQFNELRDSAAEEIELAEDLVGGELELLALWHVHKSLLGDLVLFLVGSVELEAGLEDGDELLRRVLIVVPQDIIIHDLLTGLVSALTDSAEVQNVVLAVVDHLLSDLDEQASHSIVGVVVSGDGVDHLDAVHQGGQGVLDGVGRAFIERLDELLQGRKVLNVVLGLVESLGNSQFNASPL